MNRDTRARFQLVLIVTILLAIWLWAAIHPLSRRDWLLENLLVFLFFGLLAATHHRFAFSLRSYWLFTLFMSLHLYGSHYTYSETPLGHWLQSALNLERNHYDRAVHFSFGLLLAYPFREFLMRRVGLASGWAGFLCLSVVLSFSAVYEQVEMYAALVVDPELGSAFLGTQGDEWDAQKDTGLAFLGALTALAIISLGGGQSPPKARSNATPNSQPLR